ncbi:MAG: Sec-independent protein translocase protein TatB [Gammaproteobacteria bacterium]|nr:Sec-independent protein translocase protein TatB [Gammaproteobacteria bacterium]
MFDIGFWELVFIGVIALLVVGPERLPGMARYVGLWVGRFRRYVSHVKDDIEREIHAEELREMMKESSRIESLDQDLKETRDILESVQHDIEEADASLSRDSAPQDDQPESAVDAAASGVGKRITDRNAPARSDGDEFDEPAQDGESEKDERRSG